MHDYAEYGIAAIGSKRKIWQSAGKSKRMDSNLIAGKKKFPIRKNISTICKRSKLDFFKIKFFVFKPRGDVIELRENATPIDFAYSIHTDVGNRCVEARVNREIANLDSTLRSGDLVEIITNKARQWPNPDWLKFVKTTIAREKILSSLKKKRGFKNLNLKDRFKI
jgi:GTP pyrophosphokinase